jgi:hypothetical protein
MYCFTRKLAALIAAAAVLSVVETAWAEEAEGKRRFLEVFSQGYSRYEIERDSSGEQQVVAFFTGGVEFSYLGYHMSADELRYNQATGRADISGAVELRLKDDSGEVESKVSCDRIIIDGEAGEGTIPGSLSGELRYESILVSAGSAAFSFEPGAEVSSFGQLAFRLEDGVSVTTKDGFTLSTARAEYDGETGRLSAPGQVALTGEKAADGAFAASGQFWVALTGSNLTAELTGQSGFSWVEVGAVNAEFTGGWLSAGLARLEPLSTGSTSLDGAWHVDLLRGPVTGELHHPDGDLAISADLVSGVIDDAGVREAELQGTAQVTREKLELASSALKIMRKGGGSYTVSAPELTEARFDIAQLSGSEPLDIATIQSWLD